MGVFLKRQLNRPAAIVAALAVPALLASVCAASAATRTMIADARPGWASAAADRGPMDPASTVDDIRVYLAGRDPQGLTAYAAAVSDPRNAAFRHFLTAAEVAERFGPTSAQVEAATSWLQSSGLTVTNVDKHYVGAKGTVAQAQRAFDVTLHNYADATGVHRAPGGPVTVPTQLAGAVLGVIGLDDPAMRQARPQHTEAVTATSDPFGPPGAIYRAEPCSDYWGQKQATDRPPVDGKVVPWTPCGYGPQELRKAYGLDRSQLTGKGVTIGVLDPYASPTIEADLAAYYTKHNFQGFRSGQLKQYTTPGGSPVCYGSDANVIYPEEALDIEAAHNMAPDAAIAYIGAKDCETTSLIDALNRTVDEHLADLVTNSWGIGSEPPADAVRQAFEQVFQRAAVQGIGIYYSSGDGGYEDPATPIGQSDGSTRKQTNYPPESPWVTAVGGTDLGLDKSGNRVVETAWNVIRSTMTADGTGWTPAPRDGYPTAFTGGSGGGTSIQHRQPAYQAGVVPPKVATTLPDGNTSAYPMRVVPDISALADSSTGMKVGFTQLDVDGVARFHETRLGGTSLSSPLIAGIQALAQQAQGAPIGFANPQLYARYGTAAYRDIVDTQYSLARNDYTNPQDPNSPIVKRLYSTGINGALTATTGYDNVTGLGVPGVKYAESYGH
jgi:subtilase family serine protease